MASSKFNFFLFVLVLDCRIVNTVIDTLLLKVTADLIRKKAEHNDGEIRSLEELSLHQENILKIDFLQNWCRNLEILLLQSNLISRIGKHNTTPWLQNG